MVEWKTKMIEILLNRYNWIHAISNGEGGRGDDLVTDAIVGTRGQALKVALNHRLDNVEGMILLFVEISPNAFPNPGGNFRKFSRGKMSAANKRR